ncbi:MAG TPA: LPS export ABC transporter periplasmic protein LptC, partial [Gemmatimonadales bacterium]
ACTDAGVRPTAYTQTADSADQVAYKMTTTITANGVRRSFVEADTAYIYQSRGRTDLRRMKASFYDAQGNLKSTLVADRGVLENYSEKLEASGQVVVTSPDGRKLVTEHLIYDKLMNQITVDTAFVAESPSGRLSGNHAVSDIDFTNVRIQQPRGTQRGKGFLLPGQDR